jgi:hypothetical protein
MSGDKSISTAHIDVMLLAWHIHVQLALSPDFVDARLWSYRYRNSESVSGCRRVAEDPQHEGEFSPTIARQEPIQWRRVTDNTWTHFTVNPGNSVRFHKFEKYREPPDNSVDRHPIRAVFAALYGQAQQHTRPQPEPPAAPEWDQAGSGRSSVVPEADEQ